MSASPRATLDRPATVPGPDPAGCVRLALELSDPATGLDALAKVVTTLRGRRWDVRAVHADLDAATVHLTVATARAELLVSLLGRMVAVREVRAG